MNRPQRMMALVTGASSGIGEALSRELASMDVDLVLVSENARELDRVKNEIASKHAVRVHTKVCDLFKAPSADTLFSGCQKDGLHIDILVNCAGIFLNIADETTDMQSIDNIMNLHVLNLTKLCLLFGGKMKEKRMGYILNISSIASYFVDPASLTYGPTKCYIRSFSQELHCEMREHNVVVTCLMPGATKTNFFTNNNVFVPSIMTDHLMTAEKCARIGLKALFKGKPAKVPGLLPKIQLYMLRLFVRPSTYKLAKSSYFDMKKNQAKKTQIENII